MTTANLMQGSETMDRVSFMLRNGEKERALAVIEQNFGSVVKGFMENVMKYSTLKPDELARACGKIADFLENVAEKIEKYEDIKAQKAEKREAAEMAENIAYKEALVAEALARQARFEARVEAIDNLKREIALKKKNLEDEHRRERDLHRRRKLEREIKKLEERRQQLEKERQSLRTMRHENETRVYSSANAKLWGSRTAQENNTEPQISLQPNSNTSQKTATYNDR